MEKRQVLTLISFILPLFYGCNIIPNISEFTEVLLFVFCSFLLLLPSVEFGVCKLRVFLGLFQADWLWSRSQVS